MTLRPGPRLLRPTTMLSFSFFPSPVGILKLVAGDEGLVAVLWEDDSSKRVPLNDLVRTDNHPLLELAGTQLREYFSGDRNTFSIPLDARGTDFQREVWRALRDIPYGQTRTYGQIAAELGNANASRAVGAANGRNPISIIVPCHRVVGYSGKLTGFAGGLEAKARLLSLENPNRGIFDDLR